MTQVILYRKFSQFVLTPTSAFIAKAIVSGYLASGSDNDGIGGMGKKSALIDEGGISNGFT